MTWQTKRTAKLWPATPARNHKNAKGELVTLTKSPQVVWADGIVLAPDGNALFTDSAIPSYIDQLARPPSREKLQAAAPYKIYKFKP